MDWWYIGPSASLTASGETQQCGVVQGSSQAPEAGSSEHRLPQQLSGGVAQLLLHVSGCLSSVPTCPPLPRLLHSQRRRWISVPLGKYEPPNEKPTGHSGTRGRHISPFGQGYIPNGCSGSDFCFYFRILKILFILFHISVTFPFLLLPSHQYLNMFKYFTLKSKKSPACPTGVAQW